MIRYEIKAPAKLETAVQLPASKSISNRALIICALAESYIKPDNLSDCDDTEVILRAMKEMGDTIDIKAAGTAMRFMTAFLAAKGQGRHLLTGTARMKRRPIRLLVDALRHLGADIEYAGEEGFPPLLITGGRLEGGYLEMAGNVSSQFISAVLLIAPTLDKGLELHLTGDITSRPYIDLTLSTMHRFGVEAEWTSVDTITVKHGNYQSRNYYIENDWSAASYWYEQVALSPDADAEVVLDGLIDGSRQGDSSVRYIFSLLGVKTSFLSDDPGEPSKVKLKKNGHHVPRLEYDFTGAPDLAQTFVVTCALMGVKFHFTGLHTLKIKETDRIEALKQEMRKLGYVIEDFNGEELSWNGERCEPSLEAGIDTYDDHRMAMAFAPAALKMEGIVINNPAVVSKSYPRFWDEMRRAGFNVKEMAE